MGGGGATGVEDEEEADGEETRGGNPFRATEGKRKAIQDRGWMERSNLQADIV